MASKVLSLLPLLLFASAAAAAGPPVNITGSRDITKVLDQFPNFSILNKLLTQTKVAGQINSRQTITVLAVADSAMSSVTSLPGDVQEKVLSLHVVLDYYDIDKITNLHDATALLTTLFQASGKAVGKAGFLNATYVGDGQTKLGSAVDGSLTSDVIRGIAMQPYNISVIEISQAIVPPGIASGGNGGPSVGGSATPSPAPKADTPAPKAAAPVSPPPKAAAAAEAPVSPPPKEAAPTPKPSSTSPSPSVTSPSPKSSSSEDSPAPTTDGPVSSSPPTPSSAAPTTDAPASSAGAPAAAAASGPAGAPAAAAGPADAPAAAAADAPAGSSDAPSGTADAPAAEASGTSRLAVGAGIGAALLVCISL